MFYEKNYSRIGVNTDDNVPLNKQLKFPIIRCVLKKVVNFIHKFI